MRVLCTATALLAAWLATAAADSADIEFEILPPQSEGGMPTSAVVGDFIDAISGENGNRPELHDLAVLSGMDRSLSGMQMIPDQDHAAVEIVAESKIRAQSVGDIEFASGGALVGRLMDTVDMVAGGLSFQSLGGMSVVGGDADLAAAGDVTAVASGSAQFAAESLGARVAGDIDAAAGGNLLFTAGGDATMEVGGGGAATFAGALTASGASVSVESAEKLSAVANSVSVQGQELVSVGTAGATVDLSGEKNMDYIAYVWRGSAGFDSYENVLPEPFTNVEELVIRAVNLNSVPMVRSAGAGSTVQLDIQTVDADDGSLSWTTVWKTTYGQGQYSMDGLTLNFEECTINAIRLSGDPASHPTFEGWGEVLFHFGRVVSTGKMHIQTAGTLEAVAGESISVSTEDMSVAAGRTLDVSAGELLNVVSSSTSVQAAELLAVTAASVHVEAHDSLEVFSNGAMGLQAKSASANIQEDASLMAGGLLGVVAESANLDVTAQLSLTAADASVRVADDLDAFAGGTVSLSTSDVSLEADGTLEVFAGESAQLTTGDLTLDALGEMSVRTQRATLDAINGVKMSAASVDMVSAENMDLAAQSMTASITDSMSVGTGGEFKMHSGADMSLTSLGGVDAHVAEAVDLSAGSVSMRSEGATNFLSGGDVDAMVDGNLTAYAAGTVDTVMGGLSASIASDMAADIGGSAGLWAAGEVSLQGAAGASVLMGGGLSAMAGSLSMAAAKALSASAKTLSVTGSDSVKVGTAGTLVELSSEPSQRFVSFMWSSADSFDEFAVQTPTMEGATEVLLRSNPAAMALVNGGTNGVEATIEVATDDGTGGAVWQEVWSSGLQTGVISLDGLHIEWGSPIDVVGVRLTSSDAKSPTFVGWKDVTFRFGVTVASGSVSVSTAGTLEATAAESVTLSSAGAVSVAAGSSMSVSSGETLAVSAAAATVSATGLLSAAVGSLAVDAAEEITVYSQGAMTASVGALDAAVTDDVSVMAGGSLEAVADSATLEVAAGLSASGERLSVQVAGSIAAHAGDSVSLGSTDVTVNAGGLLNVFAGESASLVAGDGGVALESGGDIKVRTADHALTLKAGGAASLLSKQSVKLDSRTLDATAGTVRIDGTATNTATARITVGLACGTAEECAALGDDAITADLTALLGISADRIRVKSKTSSGAGAPAAEPASSSGAATIDDLRVSGRRSMQERTKAYEAARAENEGAGSKMGRRREASKVKSARDLFARRDGMIAGSADIRDGIRRRAAEYSPAPLSAMKIKKKAVMKETMAWFKAQGAAADKAAQKEAVRKILTPELEPIVMEAWDLYGLDADGQSQIEDFVEAVLSL